MSRITRTVAGLAAVAVLTATAGLAPTAFAEGSANRPDAVAAKTCAQAKSAATHAATKAKKTKKRVATAKKKLAKAKRKHRGVAKARKHLKAAKKAHNKAVNGRRTADAQVRKSCTSGTSTPSANQRVAAFGSLLGLLAAGDNDGGLPDLNAAQLKTLLNGLFPGATDALDPSQLSALLGAFGDADGLELGDLTSLLNGLPGASALNPSQLLGLLDGDGLSAGQITALSGVLTGLLNSLGGGGFSSPSDLVNLFTGLLGGLDASSIDPTDALGGLLGLLTAASNGGQVPSMNLGQFTDLLDTLFQSASSLLSSGQLSGLLSAFTSARSFDASDVENLVESLGGLSSLDPSTLTSMLGGGSLSAAQLSALTSTLTGVLSGLAGQSFSAPADPLSLVNSLLDLLGLLLGPILGPILGGLL